MSPAREAGSKLVRLVFPNDVDFLPLLNGAVEEVLRLMEAGEETLNAVANAVLEAGTNAAQYGREGGEVEVEFRLGERELEVVVSDRGGARDIHFIPLSSSGEPQAAPARLTTGLDAHTISISKDGQNLAYSIFDYTANLWSIKIPETGTLSVSNAKQITTGNQIIETVAVSRDGRWLAYESDLSGNADIYKKPIAGGEAIQLTTHPSDDFAPYWSPDGEKIVFHSFRKGNRDIYCMTKNGGSVQPLTDDLSHEMGPTWSSDGSKVVFFSDRTGRYEIYVISKEDEGWGEPEQLTSEGVFSSYIFWRP